MKKLILLPLIFAIFSCKSTSSKAHKKADTVITIAMFDNPYQGGLGQDSCFRIIKDSVHVGEEKNTILPDTSYYIRVIFPVYDRKDSTHTKRLKTVMGADSLIVSFMPCPPDHILFDFSNPTRPFKLVKYPFTPLPPTH